MIENVTVRRIGANEAAACIEALADVLIDCVGGGASVSFMLPLPREKAVAFWRGVADGVAVGTSELLDALPLLVSGYSVAARRSLLLSALPPDVVTP